MAISATHYALLKELRDKGELPQGGRILEIGMANWYGDAPPSVVDMMLADDADSFAVARRVYEVLCSPESVVAIDADPNAPGAFPHDLNTLTAGSGDCAYSLVINHGTAEHIFNIANVFRVMHHACEVGGLMIHESPFTGWVDHGFYCLQPTLFWDVAAANGYEMVLVATEHLASRTAERIASREQLLELKRRGALADNLMLFVAMRKKTDEPFKAPMQGVYAGSVSAEVHEAWRELR